MTGIYQTDFNFPLNRYQLLRIQNRRTNIMFIGKYFIYILPIAPLRKLLIDRKIQSEAIRTNLTKIKNTTNKRILEMKQRMRILIFFKMIRE